MNTSDLRVTGYRAARHARASCMDELPLGDARAEVVATSRDEVRAILDGDDDRLVVVVGPCSIHDPVAAARVRAPARGRRRRARADLCVVMRVYFEKPRTTVGWKGLINDPAPRRQLRDQRGAAPGPQAAARPARARAAGRLRVPRPDHAAVHRRPGHLGRDRRAHHREPGAPRAGLGPARCRSASRTAPTATSRSPSTRCRAAAHPHSFLGVTEQGLAAHRGHPRQPRLPRHPARRRQRARTTTPASVADGAGRAGDGRAAARG